MATKYVLLKDLKVGELKKELGERDMDTSGKKAELQERLRQALIEEGDDPDSFVFEVPGAVDMKAVLKEIKHNSKGLEGSLKVQIEENSRNLEGNMEENFKRLKTQIEEQIEKNSRSVEKQIKENSRSLEEQIQKNFRKM